jgi:hypothetical protein
MDEDAVLMAIGKLQGQVEGLGREIKTLTIAVGEGSTAMQAKHEALIIRVADLELNGAKISRTSAADIVRIKDQLECIEKHLFAENKVEVAKIHWIDSIYAKIGLGATAGLTVANFLKDIFHWPF